MTNVEKELSDLFDELCPVEGKADTVAGEIVRAINQIGHRDFNDGDHIGVGYGNETCNAPARFLASKCDNKVAEMVKDMWGIVNSEMYDVDVAILEREVLAYLKANPELRITRNDEDMWDYTIKELDVDDSYDDEDDEYDEDDDEYEFDEDAWI